MATPYGYYILPNGKIRYITAPRWDAVLEAMEFDEATPETRQGIDRRTSDRRNSDRRLNF
jgi:hypothetical protein